MCGDIRGVGGRCPRKHPRAYRGADFPSPTVDPLSQQLSTITDMLRTLGSNASTSAQPTTDEISRDQAPSTEIPQETPDIPPRTLPKELRKRLLLEQEKTRQYTLLNAHRLPPIQVAQKSAPPGFSRANPQDVQYEGASPTAQMKTARTTAFPMSNPHEVNVIWDEYYKNYEKEMRTQLLKNIIKAPRMAFPKFDGYNPDGWIRQCEKYCQMLGAPNDYKVCLAQRYVVDKADFLA